MKSDSNNIKKELVESKIIKNEEHILKSRIKILNKYKSKIPTEKKEDIFFIVKNKLKAKYAYLFLIYIIITFILFIGVTSKLNTIAPGVGANTYKNLWSTWWVDYSTFTLHQSIWYTQLLYPPLGANLALQSMAPLLSILAAPFEIFGNVFAYNIMFILGFIISGFCMFILAEYLTKNDYAAFIASIIYTFSAFHIAQGFSNIGFIFIGGIPLAIYFFMKVINREHLIYNAIGLGVAIVISAFMGSIDQFLMLLIILIIILIANLTLKQSRKLILSKMFLFAIIIATLTAAILGSFGFIPIFSAMAGQNASINIAQQGSIQANMLWSNDILSLFLPSFYNGALNGLTSSYYQIFSGYTNERIAYIGIIALALSIYGIYKYGKKLLLWVIITIIFGLLTLGPYVQFNGYSTGIPGLYLLYKNIPLFNYISQPNRFDVILQMCIAILAAYGFVEVNKHVHKANKKILIAIGLSAIILFESVGFVGGAITPYITTTVHVPHIYQLIKNTTGNYSILVLPAISNPTSNDPNYYPALATYYTAITHKALAGGYVSNENNSQISYIFNIPLAIEAYNMQIGGQFIYQSPINQSYVNQTLLSLYNYNTAFITVDGSAYNQSELTFLLSYMDSIFGTPKISNSTPSLYNTTFVYSTSNAISASVFKNYVAYPLLTQWGVQGVLINGSTSAMWTPTGIGAVIVYAPYQNNTNLDYKIASGYSGLINTTISFNAKTSANPIQLEVGVLNKNNLIDKIAIINITNANRLEHYSISTQLTSGPIYTNTLLFIAQQNGNGYLQIDNITFKRSG